MIHILLRSDMEAVDVDPDVLHNNKTRVYQQNAPQAREGEANVNVMFT
jgi:hypothetical protein